MQIGHRRSLDLGFFQVALAERIPLQTVSREMEGLFGRDRIQPVQRLVDQVAWSVAGVKVSFLAYPFPLRYDPVRGDAIDRRLGGLILAAPQEIALMKAYALGRRATFRDYIDLYFLLKHGVISLGDLIKESSAKFVLEGTPIFPVRLFLEHLVYLGDVV